MITVNNEFVMITSAAAEMQLSILSEIVLLETVIDWHVFHCENSTNVNALGKIGEILV